MKIENIKLVYFAYFQSIMSYEIIFLGNSANTTRVLHIKKKTFKIMTELK